MRVLVDRAGIACVFALAALISFLWTPYDVEALDIASKLQTPTAAHWFGTDHFGRDVLSMIMVGARVSIAVAFAGRGDRHGGWGCRWGWRRRRGAAAWLDEAIMRGNDLIFAFPSLV